ncbi:xanthine dehydrogenase FAD-binding subunit XdhB [Serratia aquatilis]|uniref:Xanthine dehydrogenase FAD-binding subunit XdhB n=1 Tax=Serratia aquatilis TaxID=1737515 RepID=A0ABV6E981_9GAMM
MYDIAQYYRATSIEDAVLQLTADPQARLIAGGTDVLIQLHHMNSKYRHLVDIHDLPALSGISLLPDGTLRIGSGTTFSQIIDSPLIQRHLPVLAEAAATIAGPQVRNMATLGGNICNGATSADSASPCVVMEAELEIATVEGPRHTPIHGFHTGPGKVALGQNELAVAFLFRPQHYQGYGASYYKYAMRDAMDIATIGCAAACKIEGGRFSSVKIAFGVAAPTPIRAPHAEAAARGRPFTAQTLKAVQEAVMQDVLPRSSWRASKEFRLQIIRTLAERVLIQAAQRAGGELS